ncbi:MAG TPA: DegV family protein, partial [Acidimicrobiia bacterium]|nr:DegV family protein [Acidimicrobiia bacterium]
AGRASRALGITPLFEFRDGGAHSLRPALGADAALDRIVARLRREAIPDARLQVVALHAQAPERAELLLKHVRDAYEPECAFVAPFGVVMQMHTGPGLVGAAWRWIPPDAVSPAR